MSNFAFVGRGGRDLWVSLRETSNLAMAAVDLQQHAGQTFMKPCLPTSMSDERGSAGLSSPRSPVLASSLSLGHDMMHARRWL